LVFFYYFTPLVRVTGGGEDGSGTPTTAGNISYLILEQNLF